MKTINKFFSIVLTIILLIPSSIITANDIKTDAKQERNYIVVASNKASYDRIRRQNLGKVSNNGNLEANILERSNLLVVSMTRSEAEALARTDGVITVEEDIIVTASSYAMEERDNYEWNILAVHATPDETKDSNTNVDSIKIAVLDSGISITDKLNIRQYVNLVTEEEYITQYDNDGTGHGSAVAGIIGAMDDDDGMLGVNPGSQLYSVKIFNEHNAAPLSRVIAGIQWAIENDMDIINMSFGTDVNSYALHLIVRQAYQAGIFMIAAAGNNGSYIEFPAAFEEVMAVGATNSTGQRADFGAMGNELEIMAPGEGIVSTSFFDGFSVASGTSMATPHVVGAAALLWGKDATKPADFIRQLLKASANRTMNYNMSEYGHGLLDVAYALEIYDEFENAYEYDTGSFDLVPNNEAEVEQFDNDGYVIGSWLNGGHTGLITNASLSGYHMAILKKVVTRSDEGDYDASAVKALHAAGMKNSSSNGSCINYVLTLQFLYHAAYLLKNNANTSYTTLIANAATDVNAVSGNTVDSTIITKTQQIANETLALASPYNNTTQYPQNTNLERAYKVLGFALHLTADIFAHRTMVPMASVQSTVSQAKGSAIMSNVYNLNDFNNLTTRCSDSLIRETAYNKYSGVAMCTDKNWECFKRGVDTLYVIEFCDIKWFTTFTDVKDSQKLYEDNILFYSSRYSTAANYSTNYVIDQFTLNKSYLDEKTLLPGVNGKNYTLKTAALKEFYLAAGLTWNTAWDSCSVSLR